MNYSWCARQHIDAHIIKIPLEAAQLLYAAHHALPAADDWRTRAPMAGTGERGYRPTHMNNPLSKWLRESAAHYRHAVAYGLALCEEYSHRYGREHACEAHLHWLKGHEPAIPDVYTHPDDHGEENEVARFRIARAPPCAMPDEFKVAPPEGSADEAKEESGDAAAEAGDERSSAAEGEDEAATNLLKRGKGKEKEKVATIKAEEDDQADGDGDGDDEARRIIAEAELAKRQRKEETENEEEEEEEVEEVKTMKVEVELQTTDGCVALIKTETSEETTTTTTSTTSSEAAGEEEEERVEDLLRPIEDEVAASEVAFPLHVYQSYRAYYLGQKLSLKMSTFKTRNVPHWAQERVLEIRAQPKPAPVKKEKKKEKITITTRTRRTTTTTMTAAKRKRGQAAKATEAGEDNEDEAAGDEDYSESRLTRSRSRTRRATQEQAEGEKKKKKNKRMKKNDDGGDDEGQDKEEKKKRKTVDEPESGEAVPPVRRSPRTSKARTTSTEAALSKRRKVVKEVK